jgi:hypothetical protein
MTRNEKDNLLTLFEKESRWCQHVEARDERGRPVHYRDKKAVAWDVVGGMCFLFGWERACALFKEVERHVSGLQRYPTYGDPEMAAMASLHDFNDKRNTTHNLIMAKLRGVPVHHRGRSPLAGS